MTGGRLIRKRHSGLALASLVAVVLACPDTGQSQSLQTDDVIPVVSIDPVVREPLSQTVPVIGRLVARQAGIVAARAPGTVSALSVNVGDRVVAGQVIASLERARLKAEVDLRQAEVAQARAAIETAQAELTMVVQQVERLERLRQSAAFSQARYDDKRQEAEKARREAIEMETALKRAEIQWQLAKIDLRDAEIRAPYAGVVSLRHTEVGSYLKVGDPVVTLIDDRNLDIEAETPADRIDGLVPGTPVGVDLGSLKGLKARVRAVVPDENPLTRTRTVRFTPDFAEIPKNLAANQSLTLHIPVGTVRSVLTVHKDAVVQNQGRNVVFVINNGDRSEMRPVDLGIAVGGRFEVLSGLEEKERAVVRGNERLRAGRKVDVRKGG